MDDVWFFEDGEYKVNIDKFIENLGPLDEMSSNVLMIRISSLSNEDMDKVLQKKEIKEKLAIGLFEESKNDFWAGFRRVLKYYLTVSQFLSLYDAETLNSLFAGEYRYRKYIFFSAALEKNANEAMQYILGDDGLFDEFFKLNSNFYSLFHNISYDLLKQSIIKMDQDIFTYPPDFISSINIEFQRKLLEENIDDEVLVFLVKRFSSAAQSEFFSNNPRARYLYNKFDIKSLLVRGVKFSDEILKKRDFFDGLKTVDFVDLRTIINEAERNNNLDIIERKLNNYYEEIINSYDSNNQIFKQYLEFIDNPSYKISSSDLSFIMNHDVFTGIRKYMRWDYESDKLVIDKDGVIEYLKEVTSRKLSEVIVDALFEDNIYNVWLNIKEMLRYNSELSPDKKVIDSDRQEFYRLILNIDSMSSGKKIELFHKFRTKNVNFMFYDDLRKLKDLSYDLIKKELYSVADTKNNDDISMELTNKYGVRIYDLRDKEYKMLIRGQSEYYDKSARRRNCYSVIGSDNSDCYGHAEDYLIYYGYNSFDNDRVIHMLEQDSFSGDIKDGLPSKYVNRIMTADQIVRNSSWYSEIDLVNLKNEDGQYDVKRPDFLVYYDNGMNDINKYIKESKRLNIPIVIIKAKLLEKDKMLSVPFDSSFDYYIDSADKILEGQRGKLR